MTRWSRAAIVGLLGGAALLGCGELLSFEESAENEAPAEESAAEGGASDGAPSSDAPSEATDAPTTSADAAPDASPKGADIGALCTANEDCASQACSDQNKCVPSCITDMQTLCGAAQRCCVGYTCVQGRSQCREK